MSDEQEVDKPQPLNEAQLKVLREHIIFRRTTKGIWCSCGWNSKENISAEEEELLWCSHFQEKMGEAR